MAKVTMLHSLENDHLVQSANTTRYNYFIL